MKQFEPSQYFFNGQINFIRRVQGNGLNGAYRIQAAGRGAAPPDAEPGVTGIWILGKAVRNGTGYGLQVWVVGGGCGTYGGGVAAAAD